MSHTEDPARALLRHTLATVAYRGGKAVRGAPESFAAFRACDSARTPAQIAISKIRTPDAFFTARQRPDVVGVTLWQRANAMHVLRQHHPGTLCENRRLHFDRLDYPRSSLFPEERRARDSRPVGENWSQANQSGPPRLSNQGSAFVNAQFAHDVGPMSSRGLEGNSQRTSHLFRAGA